MTETTKIVIRMEAEAAAQEIITHPLANPNLFDSPQPFTLISNIIKRHITQAFIQSQEEVTDGN